MDGVAYLQMLHEYVLPLLAVHFRDHFENGLFRDLWWAQDGAPAHRLLEVRDRLNGVFGNDRVIGFCRKHERIWRKTGSELDREQVASYL